MNTRGIKIKIPQAEFYKPEERNLASAAKQVSTQIKNPTDAAKLIIRVAL